MAVKIKALNKKPTKKRVCGVCGREKQMEKHQRFCSPICKSTANEVSKFGSEFKLSVGRK
jgi:predicted nucleic acid-binding Zn ribbon protein